jgi:hypothetical protein
MFAHFRRQSEALIQAINRNTEELQNIKMQFRGLNVSASNCRELLSTPPKTPKIDTSELVTRLDHMTTLLADLLKVETKREKRQGY